MKSIGKEIGDNVYVHLTAICCFRTVAHQELVQKALALLPIDVQERPNVAKINLRLQRVSLLEYAEFESDPFPVLKSSWTMISSVATALHYRSYEQSSNPPILHRKELLVQHEHPKVSEWARTTETCETLGLFDDPKTIGFLLNWERTIARKGYLLVGSNFLPLGNEVAAIALDELQNNEFPSINRHLTAMTRASLSAPVQMLIRNGLIKRDSKFFDYGCGRGDDIASLRENGYIAAGWDPHFAPDHEIPDKAHVVNLGFVVNVIEDPAERVETLTKAFQIASGVISIGVMLYGNERGGKSFRDGVLTSRGTFQKYFSQDEFKDYLEQALHQEAFMVAPGIAFVFADKELEQQYLASKYRSRGIEQRLVARSRRHIEREKNVTFPRTTATERRLELARPVLDQIWKASLALGRYPTENELPKEIFYNASVPTLRRALRLIQTNYPMEFLTKAREARKADLQLYFATQQFSRRPRYRQLETRLQKDIVEFFGDYHSAQAAGLQLLKDASEPEKVLLACREAAEMGLGWLEEEHSLQVHVELVDRLPVLLRAYVACAMLLTEGLSDADLVKIHVTSGKLSLLEFDDFDSNPLPLMKRRIKVNLRRLTYDLFEYGADFPKPILYWKSRYLNEESPRYAEQSEFDESLDATGLLDGSQYGPKPEDLVRALEGMRLKVKGMSLIQSDEIPGLDFPCGINFTYRDFCGGCKNFCVNGQLAGNCCTPMELQLNDRHERTDRQPAG